ncbi:MAG: sn-glycerol 3-phosphate transport system permease protein [Moorella sp. (in: firmicutes)]|nr:sn-glycerol 3-phosphate transport system permease protein [Moorella sp. (in: firmicutes)]
MNRQRENQPEYAAKAYLAPHLNLLLKGMYRSYLSIKGYLVCGGFLAPALILLTLFTFWPLISTLKLSFYRWNMVSPNSTWVGLTNYQEILWSREFWLAFWHTIEYTLILLVLNLALPYIIAYLLTRLVLKGQDFYRAVIFLPSVLSLAVAAIIFLWLYNPLAGPLNTFLRLLGLPAPPWLSSYGWVIPALAIITAWKSFGYNFIVLLAGMVAVPGELIEAARLEKASNWQIFWRIVRPLTSGTALYVLVMTVIMGSQYVFVPIQMLTNGGPDQASTNLVFLIYQYAFNFFQAGKAAAAAMLVLLIFGGLLILQKRVLEKGVYYEN